MGNDLSGRLFERQGNHMVPCDHGAVDLVQSFREGQRVLMDAHSPRSPENHAHFFAILHQALTHLEGFQDEDALLDAVKIAVGHVRPITLINGEIAWVPKSIRFAAMPEPAFRRFKDRALHVLTQLLEIGRAHV